MQRTHLSSHLLFTTGLITLFFIFILASVAFCQTSRSVPLERELYYKPEHLVWARMQNDQLQRQPLLPLLSRQQVVIILEQPTDEQRRDVEAVLHEASPPLPEIDTFRNLPLSRETTEYAVGYIQDPSKRLHPKTLSQAAAYLITFKAVQPTGVILKTLHDLTHMPKMDFALPVFAFPGKTVTPFIQFDVEFLAPELILGGTDQIQTANSRSYVTAADSEQEIDFNQPRPATAAKRRPSQYFDDGATVSTDARGGQAGATAVVEGAPTG